MNNRKLFGMRPGIWGVTAGISWFWLAFNVLMGIVILAAPYVFGSANDGPVRMSAVGLAIMAFSVFILLPTTLFATHNHVLLNIRKAALMRRRVCL